MPEPMVQCCCAGEQEGGGLCFCIDFCKLNVRTKKDLPTNMDKGSDQEPGWHRVLFLLGFKAGFWQIAMDETSKQYTTFTVGNIGFFECKCMPLWLCNAPAMFQRLMQNCLCELNLTYYLIYLDDMIIFSKIEEEHLHHLHIVFKHFIEHNLKFRPTNYQFFKNEINYLAHHISKEGVQPNKENLKAVARFAPPQIHTEILAFLGLVGHYQWFIKGFMCIM